MSAVAMTKDSPDREICIRMAESILNVIEKKGRCSILDLKAEGFSLDDIARNWPTASDLAETKRRRAWYGEK